MAEKAAVNKLALLLLLVLSLVRTGGDAGSLVSGHGGRSGSGHHAADFVPVPRRPGGAASGVVGRFWALYRSSWILELVAGCWCVVQAPPAGHGGEERSGCHGVLCFWCFIFALLCLSPAGRGGEGRRRGQGVFSAVAPASCVCAQCRGRRKRGGCGMEELWPCSLSVLRFRRLRRTASAAFSMSGVLPSRGVRRPGGSISGGARRWSSSSGICGGSASFAVVLSSSACFICVFLYFCCCMLC